MLRVYDRKSKGLEKKGEQKDEFDRSLSEDFWTDIKFFWKSVRLASGKNQSFEVNSIRDQNIFSGYISILVKNITTLVMDERVEDDENSISMDETVKA